MACLHALGNKLIEKTLLLGTEGTAAAAMSLHDRQGPGARALLEGGLDRSGEGQAVHRQ